MELEDEDDWLSFLSRDLPDFIVAKLLFIDSAVVLEELERLGRLSMDMVNSSTVMVWYWFFDEGRRGAGCDDEGSSAPKYEGLRCMVFMRLIDLLRFFSSSSDDIAGEGARTVVVGMGMGGSGFSTTIFSFPAFLPSSFFC